MSEPARRGQRRTHLDASVMPVEQALLARAEAISKSAVEVFSAAGGADSPDSAETLAAHIRLDVAEEFRALAEELHWH